MLAEAIERKIVVCDELVVFDVDAARAEELKASLDFPVKVVGSVDELLACEPKVVVEAASQQAVREYLDKVVLANVDLIVMSTGALLTLPATTAKSFSTAQSAGSMLLQAPL